MNEKEIVVLLKEILNSINKLDKTQQEILKLFRKYDDEYIQEIEKDGLTEKS